VGAGLLKIIESTRVNLYFVVDIDIQHYLSFFLVSIAMTAYLNYIS